MSDGMGREFTYLSSHATNRYFIPNWGSRYNHRIFPVFSFPKLLFVICNAKNSFMETVICYLLFVTQKIRFWKLSTVKL